MEFLPENGADGPQGLLQGFQRGVNEIRISQEL